MKSLKLIIFCLAVCLISASTLSLEEQQSMSQLSQHLVLRKVKKACATCDPKLPSSFKLMVDFDMFKDLKDQLIKPYVIRAFKDFAIAGKLYQEPADKCVVKGQEQSFDEEACKKAEGAYTSTWDDTKTDFRRKVSNLKVTKFEINWDQFIVAPIAAKPNQIQVKFVLKNFEANVDVFLQSRKSGFVEWVKNLFGYGTPWADPKEQTGSLVFEDFVIDMALQLEPNRQDLATCFTVGYSSIFFDWKKIEAKGFTASKYPELAANWIMQFKGTFRFVVDKIARPLLNMYLKSALQGFSEINIPIATQTTVLNFKCTTQATAGPQIVQANGKNYFEFGVGANFQQVFAKPQESKADQLIQKFQQLEQRLAKSKKCVKKPASFNFDFNFGLISNIKEELIKPYFKNMFQDNKFRIQEDIFSAAITGASLNFNDLRVNSFNINWDKFYVGPQQVASGAPKMDALQVTFELDKLETQLAYKGKITFVNYEGDAIIGIDGLKLNIVVKMAASEENSCFKLSLDTLDFSWTKIHFQPFENKILDKVVEVGINSIQEPLKLALRKFILPKVNAYIEQFTQFTNTKVIDIPIVNSDESLSLEVTWSASDVPAIVNQQNNNFFHIGFAIGFKDTTNYAYLDKKKECTATFNKCLKPAYRFASAYQLDKYEKTLGACEDKQKACLVEAEKLKPVVVSPQTKLLRLAKRVHQLRMQRKQRLNKKHQQKSQKKHAKQSFLQYQ